MYSPCCMKQFINGLELLLVGCGHVYCLKCKPLVSSCHVCQEPVKKSIKILPVGTGFTAKGQNQAVAATVGAQLRNTAREDVKG